MDCAGILAFADQPGAWRRELSHVLHLAWPLVLANVGWMAMGIVDTMMVGRLSAEAIGAVSLGGILFGTVAFFGVGLLAGLETLVPQAFGAGNFEDCDHSLCNAIFLSALLSACLMLLVWLLVPFLPRIGTSPSVLQQAIPYMNALNWGLWPTLVFFAFRSYLQGMNQVRPIMFTLVTANLVNAGGNWVLIYGHWGFPAMGAEGSGWSTTVARVYMAGVLAVYALYYNRRHGLGRLEIRFDVDAARLRRLLELGLPVGLQITLEVGVFAVATALIARLSPVALAAHQIALNLASLTFMVPLGVGSAAAVRVGQALGRGDVHGAARSGWAALALGAAFMASAALAFLLFPRALARAFTPEEPVINTAASLLMVAAFFQLFDGLQVVATGALRGAGDTRTPMVCHLCGYWILGLPLGYLLGFRLKLGAAGLWMGLCLALILIGSVLLLAWHRKVPALAKSLVAA